jgi:hypothetical protein
MMKTQWQVILLWGVGVGPATGVTAIVLAVVVVNQWFDAQKGVVMGALSAANAGGEARRWLSPESRAWFLSSSFFFFEISLSTWG